ncbi:MAG: TIGR03067 domain-containing protein [Planctomycetes bacterium]|nr:TIGR03067 domain-containing protein [Planctomycetota bacterium]
MKRCCVAIVLIFASTALCQEGDGKAVQGTWKPMSAEFAGAKFPEAQLKAMTLVLTDGKYTVTVGEAVDKGTFKFDDKANPKSLDIVGMEGPNKGKTMLAIYELKGDTLRVCYDIAGKTRPTKFETSKELPFFLAVYRRDK